MAAPVRVNVIGYASATIGLGVIAREFAKALIAAGHEVALHDLDAGGGRSGRDQSLASRFVAAPELLPDGLNLWVLDATSLVAAARRLGTHPVLASRFHAAFVWWELPHVPADWVAAAEVFDAVVTGSEFVREVWAAHVTRVPVLLARTPLDLPKHVEADRGRFGFTDGEVVVYTGFEALSDPARKNPFAAIEAFRRTAGTGPRSRLVVKVNHAESAGPAQASLERLQTMVASDPRIELLTDPLDHHTLLQLYASVDVAVSLHRAEGLGLMPLEAMRLGKPVVATGWSGNLTYMDHTSAALVRYSFTAPDNTAAVYSPAQLGFASHWAEPSVDHAAAWLQQLIADRDLRASMGLAAADAAMSYDALARRLGAIGELQALAARRALAAPRPRDELVHKMERLCRERAIARLSPRERRMRKLREVYDRHIGWRLQRGAG